MDFKANVLNKLDEKGYQYKEKTIDNEEYIIITNGISSCAIQIDGDIYSLYEIVYDFGMDGYFLSYRNHNKIDDIERMFNGINFLIRCISFNSLKESYGLKEIKNKELKLIKEILINSGFIVFELIDNEEYILFSNNNKKWVAINYKNNEYIYSDIYVNRNNKLSIESSHGEKYFKLSHVIPMIYNTYEKDLDIY